jgi:dTDP-4-dehydrorhamnose reductase
MNRPLLITGASGQLGDALARLAARRNIAYVAMRRPEFDFDRPETMDAALATVKPWAVLNAAAYTAVDAAERDADAARQANHIGPARLAALCAAADIPLLHVSTDYVFDGCKGSPYIEEDATNPAGVYGATKRDGELAVLTSGAKAIILRTAWIYSAHGKNFARTMLNAARNTGHLRVVADQKGTPTAAGDLAGAMLEITARLQGGWRAEYGGIFHATCAGETSWHGFACAIFAAAAAHGIAVREVDAITTTEWPTPAKRPADSRLDCTKLFHVFGCRLPPWEQALPGIVSNLLQVDRAD